MTYRSDKDIMMDAERARRNDPANRFMYRKVEITEVSVDLDKTNRACVKVVGNRAFTTNDFVRLDEKGIWFKRQNEEEVLIKNRWIKNSSKVYMVIRKQFNPEEPKQPETKRMFYGEYKKNYANCKTVRNSYDAYTKTIEVIIG